MLVGMAGAERACYHSALVTALHDAIGRAQRHLLSIQAPDGHWVGELEADRALTAEYSTLLPPHRSRRPRSRAQAVRYLKRRQNADGGWSLFDGGAVRPLGDHQDLLRAEDGRHRRGRSGDGGGPRARARHGRADQGQRLRKISLALFGEYDWNGVPTMPVEIMLLPPPFFLFNIYEVSYWSRCVIVPLLIIMDRKPDQVAAAAPVTLDELWPGPREQHQPALPARAGAVLLARPVLEERLHRAWTTGSRSGSASRPRPLRKRAIEAARLWLEERTSVPGGLGGIYPAMANSVLALRLLGYPEDHPAHPRPAQGDRGARRRARRRALPISPARRRCGTPRWPPTP